MMSPGYTEHPEHQVRTEPIHQRVEIFVYGEKVAETTDALRLLEPGHVPKVYVPRNSLRGIELIKCGDYHCPYKGQADLYNVKHGSNTIENGAWSYLKPYDEVSEIKDMVAFYPDKVQLIRITG